MVTRSMTSLPSRSSLHKLGCAIMIDPFAIVRAVATLAAAIVVGSGVLVWYTRDALAPAGGSVWRRRVVLSVLVAAFAGAAATSLSGAGPAPGAAGRAR